MRIIHKSRKLAVLVAVAGAAITWSAAPALAVSVPYSDPGATGFLGFCDSNKHPVTGGSIDSTPLAQFAVGSVAAPAGYDVAGATATLMAYQPRKDVPVGEFSGLALTAASRYTNYAHPMAGITALDQSLADFTQIFPAQDGGFLQLRLYLGAPNEPVYRQTYAATDIQITGKTWKVIRGGTPDCNAGTYTTVESILLPQQLASAEASVAGSAAGPKSGASAVPGTTPSAGSTASGTRAGAPSSATLSPADAQSHASQQSSGSIGAWIGGLAVLLVAGGGGAWALIRRRNTSATG